jgi:hypothetical protein
MRRLVSNNIVLFFFVILLTIDASRIFYLPLPKIHSSHLESNSPSIAQESEKKPHENKRSINYEFIPLWAMENDIYEEPYETNGQESDYGTSDDQAVRSLIETREVGAGSAVDRIPELQENRAIQDPWYQDTVVSRAERLQSNGFLDDNDHRKRRNDTLFLVIVGTCSLVGILGLVAAAIFWYKIQKKAEAALDAEYPSYGVTGPGSAGSKISPSSTITDRKLAQSAQMFHYQQQRQQMMAQEKSQFDAKPTHADDSDDDAPPGGDYTVYECPGLAPTGEMEVRNPLFAEPDSTSTGHPTTNNHYPQPSTSPPKEKSLS